MNNALPMRLAVMRRRGTFAILAALAAIGMTFLAIAPAAAQTMPTLRLGALSFGTVNWELDTIKANKLDEKNGFKLEVVPMGGGNASDIAFLGGEIDAMVSDWIWAAAQVAEGRSMQFIPYSTAVGSVMAKPSAGIKFLPDLKGKRIGIAGGALDKNWLILQAYAKQEYGMDLAAETKQEFGAPPLMFKAALNDDIDAVINFWHFQAKARAAGMEEVIVVQDAAEAMGLDPTVPLLGYIVGDRVSPEVRQGLFRASRQAKAILISQGQAWEALRGRIKPKNEAEFNALREGWLAGVPPSAKVDEKAVAKTLEVMAELGGKELVGKATTLPKGLFVQYKE